MNYSVFFVQYLLFVLNIPSNTSTMQGLLTSQIYILYVMVVVFVPCVYMTVM